MAGVATEVDLDKINQADADLIEGRVPEAIRALEEVVAQYPECEPALRRLAYAYPHQERFIDASRMIERAMEIDASGVSVKNATFFRCQIAFRILDGLPPNGDHNPT
jgi:tetratricopeptide (TPR) repeat protein